MFSRQLTYGDAGTWIHSPLEAHTYTHVYSHTYKQSLIEDAFAPTDVWGRGNMDLFSIDIDGMEYHLLKHVLEEGWRPRVVVSE
jgi:hypothetical protein